MSDGDHCECHEQLCDAGRAKLIAAGRDQGLEAAAELVEDADDGASLQGMADAIREMKGKP